MDCKHEKLQIISTVPHGTSVICATFGCESHFERGEYIILTKAQDKLREDVVKAVRSADPKHIAFLLDTRNLTMGAGKMNVVEMALDALDKGDNERGL